MTFQEDMWFMGLALEMAQEAYNQGEVPVGAVVVSKNGELLAKSGNLKEATSNPCGHAEIIALQMAGEKLKNWRLEGCSFYVTLEPCPMCLGALVHSRVDRLVFGAYDSKAGALGLNYNLYKDKRLNHNFSVLGGLRHFESSRLLSQFFKERRLYYRRKSL